MKNNPVLQKLAKALTSPDIKRFLEDKYEGSSITALQTDFFLEVKNYNRLNFTVTVVPFESES